MLSCYVHSGSKYTNLFMFPFSLLGFAYQGGVGVSSSRTEAKKYFKLAAEQGHQQAAIELAKYWF